MHQDRNVGLFNAGHYARFYSSEAAV